MAHPVRCLYPWSRSLTFLTNHLAVVAAVHKSITTVSRRPFCITSTYRSLASSSLHTATMAASVLLLSPTTPPDYHRIVSETLVIPNNQQQTIPVGLLACQRDPLLRELNTVVISAHVHVPAKTAAPAKKSKSSATGTVPAVDKLLEVVTHDTVIFPEGGGQPSDIGTLTDPSGAEHEIVYVKRVGGHAVHFVKVDDTDKTLQVLSTGAQVKLSLGKDGLDRRIDHMSLHTSQHLLSALLETRFGLATLSWSLTTRPQPCYIEIPRAMTATEIASLQDETNQLVFEGRKVYVEVQELDGAKPAPPPPGPETGRVVGKGVPSDYTGGVKRMVVIDGIDRSPCCGTHLPSLHNLQVFIIPQAESVSRSTGNTSRLYFFAGPRLIEHLTTTHSLLSTTASALSCGAPEVPTRVARMLDDRQRTNKRVEALEDELATRITQDLVDKMNASAGVDEDKKPWLHHLHQADDSANPLTFLGNIANKLAAREIKQPFAVVITSSPTAQSAQSVSVVQVFGSDDALVKRLGEGVKAQLSVKGGGKGPRWSGKLPPGVVKADQLAKTVEELFSAARQA